MFSVKEVPLVWITLNDGVKLAASLWLPQKENGDVQRQEPCPALLEFLPYYRMDWTKLRDSLHFARLAASGFVGVRVDMRGSGDSEGLYYDEYEQQEQDDCCEVIDWISNQAWCSGQVGMMGKSWGGFNGLQVAARRPPALKAIISVYSTDDRYADDIHYMGGCVMGTSGLSWASVMALWNARPPEPLCVGKRWKQIWLDRLRDSSEPWIHKWLSHQSRDHYWKHGSVCEDLSQITCPVLLIGGWSDLYTNPVFRMAQNLSCPTRAIVGPWTHYWPAHGGTPGPNIDHVDVFVRWFDYHLKKIDNGIMDEPKMVLYMKEGIKLPPYKGDLKEWPGQWICEDNWPSTNVTKCVYKLDMRTEQLVPNETTHTTDGTTRSTRGNPACGMNGGNSMACSSDDVPSEQSRDDSLSLCWDTSSLSEPLALIGFPVVSLQLSCNQTSGMVAMRLCDVNPDDSSTLITRGILNLTHRNGHDPESIADLVPNKVYSITLEMDAAGYEVPADHKIRLALSSTYWPVIWPSPIPTCLTVHAGEISLPVRIPSAHALARDNGMQPFKAPMGEKSLVVQCNPGKCERITEYGPNNCGKYTVHDTPSSMLIRDTGTYREESCKEVYAMTDTADRGPEPTVSIRKELTMRKAQLPEGELLKMIIKDERNVAQSLDPEKDSAQLTEEEFFAWDTRMTHDSDMWSDRTHFHVRNKLTCYHGNEVVFDKTWEKAIKRE